jgi:hypothetical protein
VTEQESEKVRENDDVTVVLLECELVSDIDAEVEGEPDAVPVAVADDVSECVTVSVSDDERL